MSTRSGLFTLCVAVCVDRENAGGKVCILFISMGISANFAGINPYLRKIALTLKLKKVIEQQEDRYVIKTCSTFRNYAITFRVGQEFQEFTEGLDNRHVKVMMEFQANVG